MLKIFSDTDRIFDSNGDAVLNSVRAKVHKEDGGEFYLDIESNLSYIDYLVAGNIIVAPTPQGEQAFRITNPVKTNHKISVRAPHVFYDSLNYLIEDSYVVDNDCNYALDHLNSATEPQSAFTTVSDVTTVNSLRCVRKSLCEAVFDVLERWGGHLVRNNFQIEIRAAVGADNGVTVQFRKNLKDISCQEDWDDVVTKLLPVGYNGLMLPEVYVESAIQYDIPYTKTVSFSQDVAEDDYIDDNGDLDEEAYQAALIDDLRQQAEAYVEQNSVPRINYTLKANLEKITDVGDTVQVYDERLGINILTNVISYDYDCILGQYTEIEFGNFQPKLSDLISNVTEHVESELEPKVEEYKVTLGQELKEATARIWNALGNSYVIYDGDKILVVDTLPKEDATYCIMINSGGIGFSSTGINGTFNSAWTIDGTLDMQQINVINLTANLIRGGTLKLGSESNVSGALEVYDEENALIGLMDKDGLKMFGSDGSYVVMNESEGFAGYDAQNNKIYWASEDEFHMKKSVVEEEITLCGLVRFIPITISNNGTIVNEGIGLVSNI